MKRAMSESSKLKAVPSILGVSSSNIGMSQSIKRRRNLSNPFSLSEKVITTVLLLIAFSSLCAFVNYVPIDPKEELPVRKNKVSQLLNDSQVQFQSLQPEMEQLNVHIQDLVGVLKNSEEVSQLLDWS